MLVIKKRHILHLLLILVMSSIVAACDPDAQDSTPEILPSETPPASKPGDVTAIAGSDTQTITLWVPPPLGSDTDAGAILSEHLEAFEAIHQGFEVVVRLKDENGTSGILETLSATSLAAPSKLPDLVVLGPDALHTAALKGLIMTLDGIIPPPQQSEWYKLSISAAFVDGAFYGLPFSSKADAFAYNRDAYESEPRKWIDLLGSSETFLIPLGDERATFTFVIYREMGGRLSDETGFPTIEQNLLADILNFYASANQAGILPLFTLQLKSSTDTLDSLQQGFANSGTIPVESFLNGTLDQNYVVTPLPTRGGLGVILAKSYAWAVVDKNDIQFELLSQLLEWLQNTEFLAELSFSMGSLPVNSSALDHWPEPDQVSTISRLLSVAIAEPSLEEVTTFGDKLRRAIDDVLNERVTPDEAASDVVRLISGP